MTKNKYDPNLGYCDSFQASLSSASEVAHHLNSVSCTAKVWVDPISACPKSSSRTSSGASFARKYWVCAQKSLSMSPHRRSSSAHSCRGLCTSVQDCHGNPEGSSDSGSECWFAARSWISVDPGPKGARPCSSNVFCIKFPSWRLLKKNHLH